MSQVGTAQTSRRVLGVYAHPDDESFCAGGTLARHVASGADVMVVSATRGEAGVIRDATAATRQTLGQVRMREFRQACQHLGIQDVLCLDFGDGQLSELNSRCLVAKVTEVIRMFCPDIVLTFGQDGAYGHPDHIAIGAATDEAFTLASHPDQFPEQLAAGLSLHAPGYLYHSYFPRRCSLLLEHLVHWLKHLGTRFHGPLDFIHGLTVLAEEITTLGYCSDDVRVAWYAPGLSIIEQGESAVSLYFILSGQAEVIRELPNGRRETLAEIGPGSFIGEEGLASKQPRNAHVIAQDSVSCLVLSPSVPTAYAGRGATGRANLPLPSANGSANATPRVADHSSSTICMDVADYIPQKMAAIAAHRTQCPITPDILPADMLQAMFAREYFVRIFPRDSGDETL